MTIYIVFLIVVCGASLAVMWETVLMNMRLELTMRYTKIDLIEVNIKRLEDSKSLWSTLYRDVGKVMELDARVRLLERSDRILNQYPPLNDIVS